jgi:creatinine amidohydrolase/Fe(II)-dependent formamide hydrolase-like protein
LWTDIGESVAASGVKKLVLLNAHGGQVSVMDIVARDLRARLGMLVYSVSWFNLPLRDAQGGDVNALFPPEEHRFGVHAGDIETSMMRALRPETVRMALAQNFRSTAQDRAERFGILGNGICLHDGQNIINYTTEDGLIDNKVTCCIKDNKEHLWIGTEKGLSCFDGKNFSNGNFKIFGVGDGCIMGNTKFGMITTS